MNPSKASGFITVYQGNPPTALAEFRPVSVQGTKLGVVVQEAAAALNEKLKTLYAEGSPTGNAFALPDNSPDGEQGPDGPTQAELDQEAAEKAAADAAEADRAAAEAALNK